MTLKEIMRKYKDEWLLIEYTSLDDNLNVVEGKVIAHSPNKEKIYAQLMNTKGKNVAIEYAGKLPEVAVMF